MVPFKIPYGTSDYEKIKTKGFYYVDKTRYIEELEKLNTDYPIFLRPRRFGKTLLVSMLSAYYDRNTADQFEALFGDTYIGAHKTELANQYYVMRFNFSKLNSESPQILQQEFYDAVAGSLRDFILHYQLDVEIQHNERYSAAALLNSFLIELKYRIGKQVYICIDEYDHFANNIAGKQEFFQSITGREGFVRNFYEVFKAHTEGGCIDRIFITGVTSMTLDSLTSGFNIAKNVSLMPEFNEMVGFTETETRTLLHQLAIPQEDSIMELLTAQYNGYQFRLDDDNKRPRVFNSNLVLYFLDEYQKQNKIPRSLIDSNIRSDYAKITNMFALYQDEESRTTILQDIMAGKSLTSNIVSNFTFSSSFSKEEFLSMLFYLGLLTIEGPGGPFDARLRTPNTVIRDVYYKYYSDYLHVDHDEKLTAIGDIAYDNDFTRFNALIEKTLKSHNTDDFRFFNEARLKSIFLASFSTQELYLVKSEFQSDGRKIDIALIDYRNGNTGIKYNYLIELKYLKKQGDRDSKETTAVQIQKKRADARTQMAAYLSLPEFQKIGRFKGMIYVVAGNQIEYFEEVAPERS